MIKTRFLSISLLTMMTLNYVDAMDAIDELKSNGPDITTSSKLLSPMQSIPLEKNAFKNNKPKLGNTLEDGKYIIDSSDVDTRELEEEERNKLCNNYVIVKNDKRLSNSCGLRLMKGLEIDAGNLFMSGENLEICDKLVLKGRVDMWNNETIIMQKSGDSIVPIIDVSNLSDNINDKNRETIIDGNGYTTLKYLTDKELEKKEIPSIDEIRNRIVNILDERLRLKDVNIYNYKVYVGRGSTTPLTVSFDDISKRYNFQCNYVLEDLFNDDIISKIDNYNKTQYTNGDNNLIYKGTKEIILTTTGNSICGDFFTAFNASSFPYSEGTINKTPNSTGYTLNLDSLARTTENGGIIPGTLPLYSDIDEETSESVILNTNLKSANDINLFGGNEVKTLEFNGNNSNLAGKVLLECSTLDTVKFNTSGSIVKLDISKLEKDDINIELSNKLDKGVVLEDYYAPEEKTFNINLGTNKDVTIVNNNWTKNKVNYRLNRLQKNGQTLTLTGNIHVIA